MRLSRSQIQVSRLICRSFCTFSSLRQAPCSSLWSSSFLWLTKSKRTSKMFWSCLLTKTLKSTQMINWRSAESSSVQDFSKTMERLIKTLMEKMETLEELTIRISKMNWTQTISTWRGSRRSQKTRSQNLWILILEAHSWNSSSSYRSLRDTS